MAYLFDEYVCLRGKKWQMGRRWSRSEASWELTWDRLVGASNLIRYISQNCMDSEEIYRTFSEERIAELPAEVGDGVALNNELMTASGFMDVIHEYHDEVLDGMMFEHMPRQEMDVMRMLGSRDPKGELTALIYVLKSRLRSRSRNQSESFSESRQGIVKERLERVERELKDESRRIKEFMQAGAAQPKKHSRRWFKGLGQIAQGSALSIANIGLATGILVLPVSSETASWGAISSSISGVGMLLNGFGELRGE